MQRKWLADIGLANLIAGEDQSNNVLHTVHGYTYTRIEGVAVVTPVVAGPCILRRIIVATATAAGTISLYDDPAAAAGLICIITLPAAITSYQVIDCDFTCLNGLSATPSAAGLDIVFVTMP